MINRLNRLPLSSKIPFSGRRFHGRHLQLIVYPSGHPHFRLAIIVGKKVSPLSTRRHRLKRILAIQLLAAIATRNPADYLLIVHPSAARIPEPDLLTDLESLINQLTS